MARVNNGARRPWTLNRAVPTGDCLTADWVVLTWDSVLPTADRGLRTADCLAPTGYCRLPATNPCSVPSATRPT
jgi:hypothetical protein